MGKTKRGSQQLENQALAALASQTPGELPTAEALSKALGVSLEEAELCLQEARESLKEAPEEAVPTAKAKGKAKAKTTPKAKAAKNKAAPKSKPAETAQPAPAPDGEGFKTPHTTFHSGLRTPASVAPSTPRDHKRARMQEEEKWDEPVPEAADVVSQAAGQGQLVLAKPSTESPKPAFDLKQWSVSGLPKKVVLDDDVDEKKEPEQASWL